MKNLPTYTVSFANSVWQFGLAEQIVGLTRNMTIDRSDIQYSNINDKSLRDKQNTQNFLLQTLLQHIA